MEGRRRHPHGEEGCLTRPQSTSTHLQLTRTRRLRQWQVSEAEPGRAQVRHTYQFRATSLHLRPASTRGQEHDPDRHVRHLQARLPDALRRDDPRCRSYTISHSFVRLGDNLFANL